MVQYYTYQIRITQRAIVHTEQRDSQNKVIGQPSGTFGYQETTRTRIQALQQRASCGAITDEEAKELGILLVQVIFDNTLLLNFLNRRKQAREEGALLRLELDVDERLLPEVAALPWEWMYLPASSDYGAIWFATDPYLTLVRRRDQRHASRLIPVALGEPLSMALAIAATLGPVKYEHIWEKIQKLSTSKQHPFALLELIQQASMEKIDILLEKKPHLVHLIGHGRFRKVDQHEIAEFALTDDPDWPSDEPRWIGAEQFSGLFSRHTPNVVVLQACESGMLSASQPFLGIASQIVQQSVPIVVAMQYELSNSTAQRFMVEFYKRIAQGDPVDKAVQEGRRIIALGAPSGTIRDFATPVIFMSSPDGHLFASSNPEYISIPNRQSGRSRTMIVRTKVGGDVYRRNVQPIEGAQGDTQDDFLELYSILSSLNVTQKTFYKVYRACVPEDPLRIYGYENAAILSEMLDFLLAAPVGIGGMSAILKFSERCALLSEPHMSSLRAWGEAFIQDMDISPQLLMSFREGIEAEAKSPRDASSALPLHLIIVLKTSEVDLQALRVNAWLCYGQDEPDPLSSPVEGQTYTVDAMPDLLDEMLAEVQTMSTVNVQAKAELNIEFFLPRSLLTLPVDHWKIAEGTVVLGAQYRVVIRSLDRIESKRIYNHSATFWEEKWKKVCMLTCGMNQEHIHWIKGAAAYDGEQVYYTFGGPDNNAICLCMALIPPSSFDRDNKKEFFRMVLRAGIPIVFWPKSLPENPTLTEIFCKELDQLLCRYKPSELPDVLFKQRWEAALNKAEEHHLGRCLTLLWDDPKRLPPDRKLVQIEQRR